MRIPSRHKKLLLFVNPMFNLIQRNYVYDDLFPESQAQKTQREAL